MKNIPMGFFIITLVLLLIDSVAFLYLRQLYLTTGWLRYPYTAPVFWAVTGITIILSGFLFYYMRNGDVDNVNLGFFFFVLGFISLFYLPKLSFISFGILHHVGSLIAYQIGALLLKVGTGFTVASFIAILYAMFIGKYDFQVKETAIPFANLPDQFDGFKIVQISDIHIGSFGSNHEKVERAIEMINKQEPDIVVFTGDLVINFSSETNGWGKVFQKIKAKHGKYSILGNHDYGDYHNWESQAKKQENLRNLIASHDKLGFHILLNEHVLVQKDGDSIKLAGVENWGLPPFPQFGDLNKALGEDESGLFTILLSHDPSHWDAEIKQSKSVDLTLSGHTHGFQYGIDKFGIKWSPVKYKYPKWSGLYTEGDQSLYVNIGFGVVGFPGRLGMPPEISVLTLRKIE